MKISPENKGAASSPCLRSDGITELPKDLTADGRIELSGTGITELPKDLTVGGWLDLRCTGITELPEDLTVGGSIDLGGTGVDVAPDKPASGESPASGFRTKLRGTLRRISAAVRRPR